MPAPRGRTDPRFYLTADAAERVEIPTLFAAEGVVEVLEEPPTLRPPTVGWDLWTLDCARSVEGLKRYLVNGHRKRLALYSGGSLTFVASCFEFLGWPRTPLQFATDPALNALGLTELVLNFTMTVAAVREYMEPLPDALRIWAGFRDVALPSGTLVYLDSDGEKHHVAPAAAHDFPPRTFDWSDGFPESAAYALVLQTYEWFGVEPTAIPFVEHDRRLLDAPRLRAHLNGRHSPALTADAVAAR